LKKTWSLKRTTPPATEPVTLEALKSNLHITHGYQDDTLNSYIKAGRVQAEDYQRRSYITQKWDIVLDSFPSGEICLLRGPVQEVESVTITDIDGNETLMDLTDFIILTDNTPGRMKLKNTAVWPPVTLQEIGGVRIRYITGVDEASGVPADVKHAIIIFASFQDENRGVEDTELPEAFFDLLKPDRIYTDEPV
jgi:uncharacterized phiE125 gp8 family phage protein